MENNSKINYVIEKKVRIRSANYTFQEKELLLNLAYKFKNVLENKKTDSVSVEEKNEAWRKIASEFNSLAPNFCHRAVDSLKKYYENQKKGIKRKVAEERKQHYLTGGGPAPKVEHDPSDDLLLSIVNEKTIYGLPSRFDSDNNENNASNSTQAVSSTLQNDIEVLQSDDLELVSEESYSEPDLEDTPADKHFEDNNKEHSNDLTNRTTWRKYKASDLQNTITPSLKRNNKIEISGKKSRLSTARRRPMMTVKALTSSALGEKYKTLIEKKLELLECNKKEHELRMEILKLDYALKKKELEYKDILS